MILPKFDGEKEGQKESITEYHGMYNNVTWDTENFYWSESSGKWLTYDDYLESIKPMMKNPSIG